MSTRFTNISYVTNLGRRYCGFWPGAQDPAVLRNE